MVDIESPNTLPTSATESGHADGNMLTNNTRRVKENNLNQYVVNFQPGLDIVTETTHIQQENAVPLVTVKPGNNPFWIEMSAVIGPEGGIISCEQSDVQVEIPPGAIPQTHPKQLIIVKVSTTLSAFSIPLQKDSMLLSPLVECKSPGLKKFQKDVVIKLPHRAHLGPGWKFTVHFTDGSEDEEAFKSVAACYKDIQNTARIKTSSAYNPPSEVTFTVEGKYVNITTPHFSRYTCTGCAASGKDSKRQLSLESVVYVNDVFLGSERRVDLHCYLLDTIQDFQTKVNENEKYRPRSAHKPLIVEVKKGDTNLEVFLADMGQKWPWKVDERFHKTKQVSW